MISAFVRPIGSCYKVQKVVSAIIGTVGCSCIGLAPRDS